MFKKAGRDCCSEVSVGVAPPPRRKLPHQVRIGFDEVPDLDDRLPARIDLAVRWRDSRQEQLGGRNGLLNRHKRNPTFFRSPKPEARSPKPEARSPAGSSRTG